MWPLRTGGVLEPGRLGCVILPGLKTGVPAGIAPEAPRGGVSSWVWGEPAAGLLLKGSEALAGPAGPLRSSAAVAS